MRIELHQIIPNTLKDRIQESGSSIWNQQLVFEKGQFIKIQAPSGTGKTTFQHILYRMRDDYVGNVIMNGKCLKELNENELALMRRQEISVVFQDLKLFPNLTANENISLKRLLSPDYCEESRIDQMAEALGIQTIMHQKAGVCSFGEQQRVSIIRAVVQPFKWLLLDEPFSHLDETNISLAASLIQRACEERGAGLIIADLEYDQHFSYDRTLYL